MEEGMYSWHRQTLRFPPPDCKCVFASGPALRVEFRRARGARKFSNDWKIFFQWLENFELFFK